MNRTLIQIDLDTIPAQFHNYLNRAVVYDSSSSPVELPVPCLIREDSLLRGWDPTDPDPDNPTRAEKVPVIHLESPEDIHPYIKLSVN